MYFLIYKITNNLNGNIYIGAHKTDNINDNYYGSGELIKIAIDKYGKDNFTKEILYVFETEEEMFAKEREIVDESFIGRKDTYNKKVGGTGGFTKDASRRGLTAQVKGYLSGEKNNWWYWNSPEGRKERGRLGHKARKEKYPDGFRWKQSEEALNNQKKAHKANNHQQGSKNSQYGTKWVTNGIESKKIKKTEKIPDGYYNGRVIKKS